jgi:aromatic ring-cleaving dioxygenase
LGGPGLISIHTQPSVFGSLLRRWQTVRAHFVLTDNSYDDHSRNAVWLGSPVALKLDTMRRSDRAEQYPTPR